MAKRTGLWHSTRNVMAVSLDSHIPVGTYQSPMARQENLNSIDQPMTIREGARATVSVVIPTFRRPELLQALLVSLSAGSRIPDEVIVVDNDPERSAFPEPLPRLPVRVVHAGLGISVSGARNAGWRSTVSDVCIFIDDDNVVERDAVAELARVFRQRDVGLASPVVFAGDSGVVWCAGITRSRWTGRTRCILGGESIMPAASTWHTDEMPDAFAVPRAVLEKVDGFDEQRFPIHFEESDLDARIAELGLQTIVVRDAKVRHYGWVGVSPGVAMVRATANHGVDRVHQMALSRVRFHILHTSGFPRWSTVGLFLPIWFALTSLGCLGADGSWRTRWATVRAVAAGMQAGYREALREHTKRGTRLDMNETKSQEEDPAVSDGIVRSVLPAAKTVAATTFKSLAFHTGLHRLLFYRYNYMFRPRELSVLVSCLTETHDVSGPVLEIGCAAGHTTVFLNKHLDDLEDSRDYICIDTFAGFTSDDIAVEIERGHDSRRYEFLFRAYRKDWFDRTMANNNVSRGNFDSSGRQSFRFRSL